MRLENLTFEEYKSVEGNTPFWNDKINEIVTKEGFQPNEIKRFKEGSNIVYSYAGKYVIKLYPVFFREEYIRELEVLQHISNQIKTIEVPSLVSFGVVEGWDYIIMTELQGELGVDIFQELSKEEKQLLSIDLGRVIQEFHSLSVDHFTGIDVNWDAFITTQMKQMKTHHKKAGLQEHLFEELESYVDEKYINDLPTKCLLTGEYTPQNLILKKINGTWRLTGIIDFADCFLGDPDYDLLGPILFMFQGDKELINNFLISYGFNESELNEVLQKKLMIYAILHRFSNINFYISKQEGLKAKDFSTLSKALFNF
jgi:hygromycin-B 7''-O-kinase